MIHHRKRLSLLIKARKNTFGIHAGLDNFQRYSLHEWLAALCHPHGAKAAFANLREQFVRTNFVAWFFQRSGVGGTFVYEKAALKIVRVCCGSVVTVVRQVWLWRDYVFITHGRTESSAKGRVSAKCVLGLGQQHMRKRAVNT